MFPDTICAPATPSGTGAVAIVRVSGPDAFAVVDSVSVKTTPCAVQKGHTLRRARIIDRDGSTVDDVLLAVFHAPRSFSGENMVEVNAHGGPVVVRRVLELLYAAGVRPARPGEFSERAFVNGKMDLAQAEAVADIIAAQTNAALSLAQRQNAGELSTAVRGLRDLMLGVLARIEAAIDFPDDVGELDMDTCAADLDAALYTVNALLATAQRGILTRAGLSVVLVGRPNVGKSSLLNALLGRSRAIVSPVPGTTRDTVEDVFEVRGIPVRLTDTAGLRDTLDLVEQEGVRRSRSALADADLAVLVLDAAAGMTDADRVLLDEVAARPHLAVWNKWDLVQEQVAAPALPLSAAIGWNLPALTDAIADFAGAGTAVPIEGATVTHARHQHALQTAQTALQTARQTLLSGLPIDFASGDIRTAIDAFGDVTGETASTDITTEIFSRFCIGK